MKTHKFYIEGIDINRIKVPDGIEHGFRAEMENWFAEDLHIVANRARLICEGGPRLVTMIKHIPFPETVINDKDPYAFAYIIFGLMVYITIKMSKPIIDFIVNIVILVLQIVCFLPNVFKILLIGDNIYQRYNNIILNIKQAIYTFKVPSFYIINKIPWNKYLYFIDLHVKKYKMCAFFYKVFKFIIKEINRNIVKLEKKVNRILEKINKIRQFITKIFRIIKWIDKFVLKMIEIIVLKDYINDPNKTAKYNGKNNS